MSLKAISVALRGRRRSLRNRGLKPVAIMSDCHGVGRRFWGIADVYSGQSPLQPLPDFDLDPQPPVFRCKKKVRPAADSDREIIRVFLTLCWEYSTSPTTGTGCLVVKQPFNVETFLATVNGGRSISNTTSITA